MNTTTIIRNSSNGNENKKIAPEVGTWPGFFFGFCFLDEDWMESIILSILFRLESESC